MAIYYTTQARHVKYETRNCSKNADNVIKVIIKPDLNIVNH